MSVSCSLFAGMGCCMCLCADEPSVAALTIPIPNQGSPYTHITAEQTVAADRINCVRVGAVHSARKG